VALNYRRNREAAEAVVEAARAPPEAHPLEFVPLSLGEAPMSLGDFT